MSLIKTSFFEKLVELCRVHLHVEIHDLIHITQIHYYNSPTAPLIQQLEPQKLILNLEKILPALSPSEHQEFQNLIQAAVVQDDIPLLEESSKNRVEDIELKESESDAQLLLNFFKEKIPDDDFAALRAAIYIKKRFDERAPPSEIYTLKGELIAKFGKRGLKINNLLSSGYFVSTIMPIYCEMSKHPDFTQTAFLERYNLIITEEAFAIFVSGWMMADELAPVIHNKIKKNLKYGVHYVTIHGIGKENVAHVKEILIDVEVNYPILKKKIDEDAYYITVKYWFDKNKII
jgi:hypothetical protein